MSEGDARPDKVELSVFGGGSFFQQVQTGLGVKLMNGGAWGLRATENPWKYVGIEQAFTYSVNNVRFQTALRPGDPKYDFGSRIYQYSLNPVFYFTERGSKFRPFVTAGVSALDFTPTDTAKGLARIASNQALYGAQNLNSSLKVGMNYGGGFKWHLTDNFGIRADVRGIWSQVPTFRLPRGPQPPALNVYIPDKDSLHGIQTTVGLTYYMGKKAEPLPPPPPPPPPPPQPLAALNAGGISGGTGTLCQGRAISVRSNAADPAGRTMTYRWTVNGQPMGGNSPELTFTPDRGGNYLVALDVSAPNNADLPIRTAKANTLSLNVQPYNPPTVSGVAANPTSLQFGQTSALSARAAGSACSTITMNWTVTEGTITNPTSANTTLDTKSIRFEQGGKFQSKTVTATLRVTDDRGASASGNVPIKVDYTPQAIRFSDVVFSKNSARVNNCGKRILLEELAPKAADPDYEVILVGHFDQDETPKTKAAQAKSMDMQRVMNAVAVLTGGTGTCATVDKSRIKTDWVGSEQVSDLQPGLCGTSTRASTKERRTSAVSTADQNRRVEVWLVPKGLKMPAGFHTAKTLDEKALKKLACPK